MKKMFNFSVLLYLCSSIINTECTVTDTIGKLASTLNNSPSAIYNSITNMHPGNKALCALIPLNMLALYLSAKASNKGVDNINLAEAIKLNPEAHYNEIRNFCASLTKVEPVMYGGKNFRFVSVHNPVLMYEFLEITDKSNNNPVFVDFAKLTKVEPVMYGGKNFRFVSVHNPVLMYEFLEITDKSNNNPVFVDFANKIADAMKYNSYVNNNFVIPSMTTFLAFVSGVIYTTENARA